ncbi:MAG: fructokinase [Gammaproteobacteria bacterium]|nr:fructokinase [Gammaproteobacteria bacterium]
MGGTKCVCTLGTGPDDIRAQETLPTRDPATTLPAMADLLSRWNTGVGAIEAIGVASFGPIDLRRDSPHYGRIGATPKAGWANVALLEFFAKRFAVPVGLTTDVIGAALAEGRWGDARKLTDFVYVTVGTGIGAGLIVAGKSVFGCHHPELGHVRIARFAGDTWPGSCPFHGDCLEGLASGPAIAARAGTTAGSIPVGSAIWETVAHALAQLAHVLVVTVAPQRILFGGGVISAQPHLLPRIRKSLALSLNSYLHIPEMADRDGYIRPPGLGTAAGPLGALAVAADTYAERTA